MDAGTPGISKKKYFRYAEDVTALVLSFVTALLFGVNSPLHPWINGEAYTDSSVFKTVVLMMERGHMPYRDSFDHKGPLLYILNWLGNRIASYRGIWVIEMIFFTVTFYMLYKIARLSCGRIASVVTFFTASTLLFPYFEGGNFTEEYAMPCIAVAIYVFLDYFLSGYISKKRLIASGMCCGAVLMLRPNMVSVWVVYCLAITIVMLCKKEVKEWGGFVMWFLTGVVAVILPIVIWLLVRNDLSYCVRDYILFNMKYSSSEGGRATLSTKWESFFAFFNTTVYIIAFFSTIFHLKEKKTVHISYLVYLVVTIALMVMSGKAYGHYGMILIPAVVYPISLVFSDIEKIKEEGPKRALLVVVSLYLISAVIVPNWMPAVEGLPLVYENRKENQRSEITETIVSMIDEMTSEDDRISVYGSWDIIYVLSDRAHATRYSYQFPIGEVMPEIMEEYIEDLGKELPKVIVVAWGRYDKRIREFLKANHYVMQYASNNENLLHSMILFVKE